MTRAALVALIALAGCGQKSVETTLPAAEVGFRLVEKRPFPGDLTLYEYGLDNGLRLMVVPDHSAPVVAYQTWFDVGSSDEELGHTGLAHLFEHMMFKATDAYEDGAYMGTLDALGASGLNAWTWLDETVYVQSVPVDALPTLAQLESARMTCLILDQEKLDKEREVVINERRLRVDNDPDGAMSELLHETAFDAHRYGWPTVGWQADLEAMSVEDCVSFYERWYAPNNALIVIVGDVEPGDAAALIHAQYGDLAPSELPARTDDVEPPQTAPRRAETTLPVAADRISVAYKAPAGEHEDAEALEVLDAILTSGRSARLKRALEDTGLASSVSSSLAGLQQPYLWTFDASGREGVTAEQLEEVLTAELARIRTDGVTDAEVERAARQVLVSSWSRLDAASGKASLIGWAQTATGSWMRGVDSLARYGQVTADDVERVAATLLDPNRSTTVVGRAAEPSSTAPALTDAPAAADGPAIEARAVAAAPDLAAGEVLETQLHGADVVMVFDPAMPLIDLTIGWRAGAADAGPGVANLASDMLLRGTKDMDRAAFEAALDALGASVSIAASYDDVFLRVRVLREAWPETLALITAALSTPAWDQAELDLLVAEVDNQLAQALDNDSALATRALRHAIYGEDHPYGRSPMGTRDALAGVKLSELKAFHETNLVSGAAVVSVAGGFDAQAQADLDALLAAIEGPMPELVPAPAPVAAEGTRVVIVDKPDRSQAQVAFGGIGPSYMGDAWPAYYLANEVFGGRSFSARLLSEVRVARGWSYFAYGSTSTMTDSGLYAIRLAPGKDYAADAVKLVLDLTSTFHADGPTQEELESSRSAELKSAPFLADTAAAKAGLRFTALLSGYDQAAYVDAFADIDLAAAHGAWQAAIDPSSLTVVVVATASELEAALAEVGEVTVVPYTELF